MAPANESSDDLSVRLDWPVDPLIAEATDEQADDGPIDVEARLAALESSNSTPSSEDVADAIAAIAARVEQVTTEIVKVLRSLNTSLMRTRTDSLTSLDKRVGELRQDILGLVEENASQRAAFGADLAAELKAWRRKFPTKTPSAAANDPALEELVTRLADEMEIRVLAALKKSGAVKKR